MELIRDLQTIAPRFRGGVLSVGVFDGVHVGHQKVLGRAVERAEDLGVAPIVFTFHPHPLGILRPAEAPLLLQTFGQKLELLRELGIAAVVWPEEMHGILAMPPEAFISRVVHEALDARVMVEGADFRFGAGAGGDRARLMLLAQAHGIEVEFVEDVAVDGERISSTRIRRLLADGRVAEAARCLGRPFAYLGTVVEGQRRGARMGYPTVNVAAPRFLTPAEGVYAGWALIHGLRLRAAISVGRAPTFRGERGVVVEAFLMDFDGELYGEQIVLEFVEYIRPQIAFDAPEALRLQVGADCQRVRALLGKP